MDMLSAPLKSQDHPLLRWWNSISTSSVALTPTKPSVTNHRSGSNAISSDDLELLSIKPASHTYSSLRDLLPSVAVNSPKPKAALRIRNRLVKEAAWAYLQPMSAAPGSTGGNFFRQLWTRVTTVIHLFYRKAVQTLDWTLRVIPIRSSGLRRSKMFVL